MLRLLSLCRDLAQACFFFVALNQLDYFCTHKQNQPC